jgi:hypothetical protein
MKIQNCQAPLAVRVTTEIGYPIFDRPRRRVEGFVLPENYVDANFGSPNHLQ